MVCVSKYIHSNNTNTTKEDNRVHSLKLCTKPMGAFAKKSINKRGTIGGPGLQLQTMVCLHCLQKVQ